MRGRRSKSEGAHPSTRSALSPVEMISSGTAAGVWLLDCSSSRLEVAVQKFGRFLSLRGQFDRFTAKIEIGPGSPPVASLVVDLSSMRCRTVWCGRRPLGDEFFVTIDDPTVRFRSEHVLLVEPDQAWVIGTLTGGGRSASVAFEAMVTLHFPYDRAVLDVSIVTSCLLPPDWWAPSRRRPKVTFTLHLVFLRR
jgi:polyisoprenoid-binding protein YceI